MDVVPTTAFVTMFTCAKAIRLGSSVAAAIVLLCLFPIGDGRCGPTKDRRVVGSSEQSVGVRDAQGFESDTITGSASVIRTMMQSSGVLP